jgi:hypothetical protein
VAVFAFVSYLVGPHTVAVAQTRFDVAVGAEVWYSAAVQTRNAAHVLSLVFVFCLLMYWLFVHRCKALQDRSLLAVAGLDSYCVL